MDHTKTIKTLKIILVCFLALASIKLCYSIFGYSVSLFIDGGGNPYQKVKSNYTLTNEQMEVLSASSPPICNKVHFPNDLSARSLKGFSYSSKNKFQWEYNVMHSGECRPKSIAYSYLVLSKSLTGFGLFLFDVVQSLLIILGVYFLIAILSNTTSEHPFVYENSIRLKWIAYLLFAYAFIDWIYEDLFTDLISSTFLSEGAKWSISINNEKISFALLLIGFLILIISSVFKYGYQIKAENDLTI